jgi:hypothetical protein
MNNTKLIMMKNVMGYQISGPKYAFVRSERLG